MIRNVGGILRAKFVKVYSLEYFSIQVLYIVFIYLGDIDIVGMNINIDKIKICMLISLAIFTICKLV